MNVKEFKDLLAQYPEDMDVKLLPQPYGHTVIEFTEENLLLTSETAHVDEDDKIVLGDGKQYLLLNPIIY